MPTAPIPYDPKAIQEKLLEQFNRDYKHITGLIDARLKTLDNPETHTISVTVHHEDVDRGEVHWLWHMLQKPEFWSRLKTQYLEAGWHEVTPEVINPTQGRATALKLTFEKEIPEAPPGSLSTSESGELSLVDLEEFFEVQKVPENSWIDTFILNNKPALHIITIASITALFILFCITFL